MRRCQNTCNIKKRDLYAGGWPPCPLTFFSYRLSLWPQFFSWREADHFISSHVYDCPVIRKSSSVVAHLSGARERVHCVLEMAVEKGEKSPKIVSVEPKPKKGILSAAVNLLEEIVVSLAGLSGKPNYYLSGNFAPVLEETPPSGELKIRGTLPVREF